jgi:hypothetical protein
MAAAVAVTKTHYKYVDDSGATFRVRLADYIATQLDGASASIIGAVAADGTEPALPGGHFMRRAIVRDLVNNVDRTVNIMTRTAPMLTTPTPAGAGTINLNHGTSLNAYTYQGRYLTETRGRRA